ncbi:MAG: FtsX-like permease family protein [Clostridium sp.]|uniref:ABC transporter permease n=1 Tax=Clostridium sp. TaxID=1506 RepID=UPI00305812A9
MKSFWAIIPRYIIKNKKRVVFIALGIMLSMALIVSLSTISDALKQSIYQKMVDDSGGVYDIDLYTRGFFNFERLKEDDVVEDITTVIPIGRYEVPDTENVLEISSYENNVTDILNFELIEGRYPEKDNEIAVEKWILDLLPQKYNIGDKITIPYTTTYRGRNTEFYYKKGESQFVITGLFKNTFRDYYAPNEGKAYITPEYASELLRSNGITIQEAEARAYITIKSGYSAETAVEKLVDGDYSEGDFTLNYSKLDLENQYKKYDSIIYFIFVILVIISSIIIYNIFNVSVSERTKEIGMLRAVGCPPWKIKIMILGEGFLMAVVFIPLGILFGNWITRIVIRISTGIDNLGSILSIEPRILIIAISIGLMTILIGSYFPARKASKISPLKAISGSNNLELEGSKIKVSLDDNSFILKWVGFESHMSYVNISRNKKRFITTSLSLIITITMFIVINYIIGCTNPVAVFKDNFGADFKLNSEMGIVEERISSIPGINIILRQKERSSSIEFPKDMFTDEGIKHLENEAKMGGFLNQLIEQNRYELGIRSYGYCDEDLEKLKEYVIEGEINIDMMKKEKVLIISQGLNGHNYTNIKVGDELQIQCAKFNSAGTFLGIGYPEFVVGAIVSEDAFNTLNNKDSVMAIMSEETMMNYMNVYGYQHLNVELKAGADYEETENLIREALSEERDVRIVSYKEELAKVRRNNIQIVFAMYTIVIVVAIVSIINLINIMNMSAIMRKREFGFMRAMGLSEKQVKKIIRREGVIYGVVSGGVAAVLGTIISIIIASKSKVLFGQEITWTLPIINIAGTFIVTILITILSSVLPSRSLFNSSIIESIRDVD